MQLIFGLGNPGKDYKSTRHNIGFMALDYIAKQLGVKFKQEKFRSLYYLHNTPTSKWLLVKPETFMNLSGASVNAWQKFYKVAPKDLIVIHDDLDLPLGTLKIKTTGSSAGHNGIKSIIKFLNSNQFVRFRIGIGRPLHSSETIDYVLGRFSKQEQKILTKTYEKILLALQYLLIEGHTLSQTMSRFNGHDKII